MEGEGVGGKELLRQGEFAGMTPASVTCTSHSAVNLVYMHTAFWPPRLFCKTPKKSKPYSRAFTPLIEI